jgi:hypothetical protein
MALPPNDQTFLNFYEMGGIPLYSTRDATQTLKPVQESADIARTVSGKLVDLSDLATFRKFASDVSCSDFNSPPFDGFWPGMLVTVDCLPELCYLTGGTPSRPAVGGSAYTLGSFTFYRPQIIFRILDYQISFKEWAAETSWQLSLAEI